MFMDGLLIILNSEIPKLQVSIVSAGLFLTGTKVSAVFEQDTITKTSRMAVYLIGMILDFTNLDFTNYKHRQQAE
jgi:hypothetical protein